MMIRLLAATVHERTDVPLLITFRIAGIGNFYFQIGDSGRLCRVPAPIHLDIVAPGKELVLWIVGQAVAVRSRDSEWSLEISAGSG